jgi:hypothetical protein
MNRIDYSIDQIDLHVFAVIEEEIDEHGDIVDSHTIAEERSRGRAVQCILQRCPTWVDPTPPEPRKPRAPQSPPDLRGFYAPLVRKGIFKGVDLNALAARFWRLEAMRAERPLPAITWRTRSARGGASGHAAFKGHSLRVVLNLGTTIESAAETLLHELVHCACPVGTAHGELFCRRLIACAREAFGLDLDTAALLALPANGRMVAYRIDDEIEKTMCALRIGDRIREDPTCRFEPPPVETEEQIKIQRAAIIAARVQANEAHARAKLAAWEKKLAAAKKRAAKWRTKVRYYERRQEAAKRGSRGE